MKLYTHPFSSNGRKVAMLSRLLKLENVEEVIVDLSKGAHKAPEFMALNPMGAVPVLVDGDVTLPESNAIMLYLCGKSTDGETYYPANSTTRAQIHRWLFWMSSHWSPAIAGLNFENNLKQMFGQGGPDAGQVERHETFFNRCAAVLDGHLAKQNWMVGETLTIADLAIAAPLMYAQAAKLPWAEYANIRAWFARVEDLSVWRETQPKW